MSLYHHVARALPRRLLFRDVPEARHLWGALARAFPEALALCLMPDHIHLALPHADEGRRLQRTMTGHTRFLAFKRRVRQPLWDRHPAPTLVAEPDKIRRMIRYIHLNPTRKGLVDDPLAWPWSTHRDRVGFAAFPLGEVVARPDRFHEYVSSDGTVQVGGTTLPNVRFDAFTWDDVRDAVMSVCRAGPDALSRRGVVRTLALKTAWIHEVRDRSLLRAELAIERTALFGATRSVPARNAVIADPALAACVAAVGDPRFRGLIASGWADGWWHYRDHDAPVGKVEPP